LAVIAIARLLFMVGVAPPPFIKINKSLTYRGDKTRAQYQSIKKIPGVMISPRNPHRRSPYWNFWRVVLAGWVIRNPRPIFVGLGICIMVIYNAVTK